ncbi:MAG TPA: universal stress protein [Acidimicrobiales bacterium]|nr:universal stress protein [Acidimicrobiales bacterium]
MTSVIAAIDNSAAARPVLSMARAVAEVLRAEPIAVHVLEDGDATAQAVAKAGGTRLHVLKGEPLDELERTVNEGDVVALVLGSRDVGGGGGARPAGHLALQLAGRTDKPVIAVPPDAHPPERIRTVLIAMEGTPGKARALNRTIELSSGVGLEMTVVHVDEEVPSFTDQVQHETEAYAQAFLARHVVGAPVATLELRIGIPAVEVLALVEERRPDLVAVGWPHSGSPERGTVVREILARSPVPVLLVAVS